MKLNLFLISLISNIYFFNSYSNPFEGTKMLSQELNIQNFNIIDLTHEVNPDIPTWDLTCGYFVKTMCDYKDCKGEFKFRVQSFNIKASAGTHIDSPAHCFENANDVSKIPLDNLICDCVVIDVSKKADEKYKASIQDVQEFEKKYGDIKPNTFVIFYTGWSRFWNNPKQYHNKLQFPSVSADVAKYLLDKNISGIGIDTLSPDCENGTFHVHSILLGANKFIVENIANADKLPATGTKIFIMPLKIKDAAESPIRLVGLVNK